MNSPMHPAKVTDARLARHHDKWFDRFYGNELVAIDTLRTALQRIAAEDANAPGLYADDDEPDAAETEGLTPDPTGYRGVVATDDETFVLVRADGCRLAFGPSVMDGDGHATPPNGWDWTRYSTEDAIEAQDWEGTDRRMTDVLAEFSGSAE